MCWLSSPTPIAGAVILRDGARLRGLRTWHDAGLENPVRYRYESSDERIQVSTGYETETAPGHTVFVTRSDWAGFYVERPSATERIYHGNLEPPGTDFEALVFRVRIF
jgi:hypothetical protein